MVSAMERSAFYQHLQAAGSMTRKNPELLRLHKVTGFSVETLFRVAIGSRPATKPVAKSIVTHAKNKALTEASFAVPSA